MTMRVGVLTGGGDAPGLNAAICGLARRLIAAGAELIGFTDGWRGLIDDNTRSLQHENFQHLLVYGGTLLGSSGDNPYRIANGTLRSTARERSGTLPEISTAPCSGEDGPFESNALDVQDPGSTSVFSELPVGTTLWGTRICFLNPADVLEVTVEGGSGTLSFTAVADTLESFLGFEDPAGLRSVTIRNLGADGRRPSSYFYDEITTARADR